TQQVARVLFEVLGLTAGRKGKTGYSTDTRVLRSIRHEHPIVEVIEEWREYSKLLNTYLGPLPALISETDGRLHTTFNQALPAPRQARDPAACPPRPRPCRRSPCGPTSAGSSVLRSWPRTASVCCPRTTARSSSASSRTSRASRCSRSRSPRARTSTGEPPPR